MGVFKKGTPGFQNAKEAVKSVAAPQQLVARRTDSVADHLTTAGKDADRFLTSQVTADIKRARPQIDAATTEKEKKKIANNAKNVRIKRLKHFNVFHEDPNMIGNPDAVMDPAAQADRYLNQTAELNALSAPPSP